MKLKELEFLGSFEKETQCPKPGLPEYAFIGRSNVGKSSLINMLTQRKELAKISSTPGKTQTINFFEINSTWRIVDLPGYGYARISKKKRNQWKAMIYNFLLVRQPLRCVFCLIDSRIPLQKIDVEFLDWIGENQIPFVLVYTKVDKLKSYEAEENIKAIREGLLETWEELPQEFPTSSSSALGREDILDFIAEINNISDF